MDDTILINAREEQRLNEIKNREKRYGVKFSCPNCSKLWWHEDKDYIVSIDSSIKKLRCPYCKTIFEVCNRDIIKE